jgi:hypothetical protein
VECADTNSTKGLTLEYNVKACEFGLELLTSASFFDIRRLGPLIF